VGSLWIICCCDAYLYTAVRNVIAYIGPVDPLPIILNQQGVHDEIKI